MSGICDVYKEKMQKSFEMMKYEFAGIRAGRENPALLERISIDYFGTPTPITQVASVSSPEPRMIVVQPWDTSVLKLIEKAIQVSDIGINPQNDGKVIRLLFPQITEERRRELIRNMKKTGEDAKVAVRNIRRDAVDSFKSMKKKGEMTEDDLKDAEKKIQEITDKFCKDIDTEVSKKEKELLEI